ncbi:hypothetical protein EB809_18755 [Marinobacter sp. R17]|uniref:hypothetical protein n=1 Tax=Marinobacter sp. R17 TaxID=2484250 RepID=UPI000F4CE7B8|nr:hypothetical protein [Marinobacter sp. R17]ROT94750.1 hypothetical protein EB809_18755 [Marinobacter sp. R17]
MSTKASITGGERHHLYFEELLSEHPKSVFLEITSPSEFRVTKETYKGSSTDNLVVEIPSETMDEIAIAWIKQRGLQGALGGPVGAEFGGPECPYD